MNKEETYHWRVLIVTGIGVFLTGLNNSMLNVAIPEISSYFGADTAESGWILLSYMIFHAVFILIFGKISDIFGRRKLYLIGNVALTFISLVMGWAPNVIALIVLRSLQAIAAALMVTNTTSIITDVFPEKSLGLGLGIHVLMISGFQLIGPVIGGFLVVMLDWRWVFWFNVPLGLINTFLAWKILKPGVNLAGDEKVDFVGSFLVLIGLGGIIIAMSEGGFGGWTSPPVIFGALLFLISMPVFCLVEMKISHPIVYFKLFRNRPYAMANLALFLQSVARSSVVLLIALFYQVVHGENPLEAGMEVLPLPLGMLIASPLAGYLTRKLSTRFLTTFGLSITGFGFVILILQIGTDTMWLALGLLLIGVGSGIFASPNTESIMLLVPRSKRGVANGIRSLFSHLGQVVSTALSLTIVTSLLPSGLKGAIYSGSRANPVATEIALIIGSYRITFIVMLSFIIISIIASYKR